MQYSFNLHLPFKLPVNNGQKIVSGNHYADFHTEFNTYQKTTNYSDIEVPFTQNCTVARITFMPKEEMYKGLGKDEQLRQVVINSLHYINSVLDAFRSNFGCYYITNITVADLPMAIAIKDGTGDDVYIYVTNPQEAMREEKAYSNEELASVGGSLQMWDQYPDFMLMERFLDEARAHLYREQLIDAIVDLQTSFEIFISNTHKLILKTNGKSDEEIKEP
ncbi:hypothetical protein SAMN05428981_102462 [Bacillus sp. OV194]|nr:hypothetical protein SAMN05428981_102462 [Bacillus sp. OV194]